MKPPSDDASAETTTEIPDESHRFLVRSAEEAVQVIRERLGEHARVIHVGQVARRGLARWFRGPQLEVIAVVEPATPTPKPPPSPAAASVPPAVAAKPRRPVETDEDDEDDNPDEPEESVPRAAEPLSPPSAPLNASPSFEAHLKTATTGAEAATASITPWEEEPSPAVAIPDPAPSAVVSPAPDAAAAAAASGVQLPPPPPSPAATISPAAAVAAPPGSLSPPSSSDILRERRAESEEAKISRHLSRAGLGEVALARLQTAPSWKKLSGRPMRDVLAEVTVLLRAEYAQTPRRPLGERVAFVGAAGAGKTTSLCKHLHHYYLQQGYRAAVLKLEEMDRTDPEGRLAAACAAWRVPMLHDLFDLAALAPGTRLYLDAPGWDVTAGGDTGGEAENLAATLDGLSVESRVLVVNAAYDATLMRDAFRRAAPTRPTHVGFTHLDELTHWGKLWEFILFQEVTPVFLSVGKRPESGLREDVLEAVLEKTLP